MGCSQRKNAKRPDAGVAESFHGFGKSQFLSRVGYDERLLRFPYMAARGRFHQPFDNIDLCAPLHFNNVNAHGVSFGIVQDEREGIEADNPRKSAEEIVKKSRQVAMKRNRLRDLEKGLIFRGGSSHKEFLVVRSRLQESDVGVVFILELEAVAKILKKAFEVLILVGRHL